MHRIGVSASAEHKSYVPKAGMQICSKMSRFQEDVSKTGQRPIRDLANCYPGRSDGVAKRDCIQSRADFSAGAKVGCS